MALIGCGDTHPCSAIPNATYRETCIEKTGNCGSLPTILIETQIDGGLFFPFNMTCASIEQDGCDVKGKGCQAVNGNQIACVQNFDAVFQNEGNQAQVSLEMACYNAPLNASCLSTYDCVMEKE